MSSSSASGRKPSRGNSGRGRGKPNAKRGGRGKPNASKRSTESNNRQTNNDTLNGTESNVSGSSKTSYMPEMKDEEILIAFMPYLKGDDHEAIMIHELYQSNNDQQAFLQAARGFLHRDRSKSKVEDSPVDQPVPETPHDALATSTPEPTTSQQTLLPILNSSSQNSSNAFRIPSASFNNHNEFNGGTQSAMPMHLNSHQQNFAIHNSNQQEEASQGMELLERKMVSLLSDEDDVVSMPFPFQNTSSFAIGPSSVGNTPSKSPIQSLFPSSNTPTHQMQQQQTITQQQQLYQQPQQLNSNHQYHQQQPFRHYPQDTSSNGLPRAQQNPATFSPIFAPAGTNNDAHAALFQNTQQSNQFSANSPLGKLWTTPTPSSTPIPPTQGLPPESHLAHILGNNSPSPMRTPTKTPVQTTETPSHLSLPSETPQAKTPKKEYQPKRLWTHLEDQPGKILANNVGASIGTILDLRPRQELTARWMLPMSYLRKQAEKQGVQSIRELLKNLSVGLFRRGCTENGSQASIVSKEVVSSNSESRDDYPFQIAQDSVIGTIPFYSPRTPGHVVFRMYWNDNPLHTLATGPTLNVRVTESDFESSIRFILSNFKAKKVNPTSLSSLNSLSLVLEQFHVTSTKQTPAAQHQFESAGRAVWGCVCEARKVLDACALDYQKTTARLEKLEEAVNELKETIAEEEKSIKEEADDEATQKSIKSGDGEISENVALLREKTKMLMSGRASCERKWRDSQLAFASILKAIVSSPTMALLLRRELITKLRLEYELWCPLCEEFAVVGDSENEMWYEQINRMSQPITAEHFRICTEARSKMQIKILGFDPNTASLENILYPARGRNRQMNPVAVNVFNHLSTSMGQLYQEFYFTGDRVLQQRESIRAQIEKLVHICDCFPAGTEVAIFGSSANGYGSPKSDLDMCLQIPHGYSIVSEDDPTGAKAMATLAQVFEENGMHDVDTVRLTARIPVIKFNCPRAKDGDLLPDEEPFMECDLSMHNPLAVLNTALLRTYAEINPVSRVLASIIKRWAKARDINNPARHTLSSYGYILMLLHFLTYHKRSGNGLVSPVDRSSQNQTTPLLPNLQWMDERWPQSPVGTPYIECKEPPKVLVQHPLEENVKVNAYFFRPNASMLSNLQRLFPGQDLSLAILLASFFRYYAFEFDYKRHVVSLNATINHGIVEREVKAELDGWRNYSAALTIEDPFETFYDVAHVLRGGYYHRIRREFAVAYSKIADVASGKTTSSWNNRVVDLTNMTGMELIDWICEPVVISDREETQLADSK